MTEPRVDKITYHVRSGSPPRKLKEGDEKYVKGVLMVRQQQHSCGRAMVSNGRPVWEWVEKWSTRDRRAGYPRYGTFRDGTPLGPPPEGWKIIESGKKVPKDHMVFHQGRWEDKKLGWFPDLAHFGFEATYEGPRRAFAVRLTNDELMRKYFEDGCICISEGKLRKQPVSVSAAAAVKKYTARCKCSRHPEYKHAPI